MSEYGDYEDDFEAYEDDFEVASRPCYLRLIANLAATRLSKLRCLHSCHYVPACNCAHLVFQDEPDNNLVPGTVQPTATDLPGPRSVPICVQCSWCATAVPQRCKLPAAVAMLSALACTDCVCHLGLRHMLDNGCSQP